jgi:hypothetical protein
MRRCAQSSQRSTRPPNAAVRQRSIADMTLSWPRLTWPAWDARQAGPRRRKMSATSTAGRDNARASAGHLQLKGRAGLIDGSALRSAPPLMEKGAPSTFDSSDKDAGSAALVRSMTLASTEVLEGGVVWLRYRLQNG